MLYPELAIRSLFLVQLQMEEPGPKIIADANYEQEVPLDKSHRQIILLPTSMSCHNTYGLQDQHAHDWKHAANV